VQTDNALKKTPGQKPSLRAQRKGPYFVPHQLGVSPPNVSGLVQDRKLGTQLSAGWPKNRDSAHKLNRFHILVLLVEKSSLIPNPSFFPLMFIKKPEDQGIGKPEDQGTREKSSRTRRFAT